MRRVSVRDVTLIGLFAALSVVLSALEGLLPPLPLPGARLGLANVAVTAATVLLSPLGGVLVAVLKVLFVLLTRGVTAAWMAGCGTCLAVTVTVCLVPLWRRKCLSFVGVSVASAGAHALGQLIAAMLLLSPAVWVYAPLLLVLSIPSGTLTGLLLNVLIPRLMPLVRAHIP